MVGGQLTVVPGLAAGERDLCLRGLGSDGRGLVVRRPPLTDRRLSVVAQGALSDGREWMRGGNRRVIERSRLALRRICSFHASRRSRC